jgi:hypothetical protein
VLISNLFVRQKTPAPCFAPVLFLALLVLFAILGQTSPVVGLTGLGTTAIITAVLVEVNRKRIWDTYKKNYKKQKGMSGVLSKPNHIYYSINVRVLWPFILFLGLICLWAAYTLS